MIDGCLRVIRRVGRNEACDGFLGILQLVDL